MRKLLLIAPVIFLIGICNGQEAAKGTPEWRPDYHFTPLKNWTNDPNGLIYLNGEYHLYYQHNPFENKWGHMSWGHATSKDLLNWKHLPVAIPEKIDKDTTTWIFSGSAVWDKNNTSGFCKNGGCLVAIYTANQPNQKKESQFIAYSNDHGLTFTNYNKNPVIDLNKKDFRDPNVFWHAQSKKWIMTVALPTEFKVNFYSSENLKDWILESDFGPQGFAKNPWECPFIIQLPIDGNAKKSKWVLFVSSGGPKGGPFMQYYVGDFDGKTFKNDNPSDEPLVVDYGDAFYAAIPWNDAPKQKKIFIGWLVPQEQQTYPWRGQMSIPRDLSLRTTASGIRLFQKPSSVISKSVLKSRSNPPISVDIKEIADEEILLNDKSRINQNANWIEAEFELGTAKNIGFKLGQKKDQNGKVIQETVVSYDIIKKQLFIDRSLSGSDKKNESKLVQTIDLLPVNGKIKLQILIDKSSLEVFANDGEKVISTLIFPDKGSTYMSVFAANGDVKIKSLKIYDLSK